MGFLSVFMLNMSILHFTENGKRLFKKTVSLNHYLNNSFCIPVNIEILKRAILACSETVFMKV